jgi:hypothetical protein
MMSSPSDKNFQQPFSRASIILGTEDLKVAKKLRVGAKVHIKLSGVLKELHLSAGDASEEGMQNGKLVVDASNIQIAANSEIAELFEDEL